MNIDAFLKSSEWQELKQFFFEEFLDKPLKIKTDGKSIEKIALEVMASNIASKKLALAIKKFERMAKPQIKQDKPYV